MAQQFRLECDSCQRDVLFWDQDDYYSLDDDGQKKYIYFPEHSRLSEIVGSDVHHLCMGCRANVMVDSRVGLKPCKRCKGTNIVPKGELWDQPCPYCKKGIFRIDFNHRVVS